MTIVNKPLDEHRKFRLPLDEKETDITSTREQIMDNFGTFLYPSLFILKLVSWRLHSITLGSGIGPAQHRK